MILFIYIWISEMIYCFACFIHFSVSVCFPSLAKKKWNKNRIEKIHEIHLNAYHHQSRKYCSPTQRISIFFVRFFFFLFFFAMWSMYVNELFELVQSSSTILNRMLNINEMKYAFFLCFFFIFCCSWIRSRYFFFPLQSISCRHYQSTYRFSCCTDILFILWFTSYDLVSWLRQKERERKKNIFPSFFMQFIMHNNLLFFSFYSSKESHPLQIAQSAFITNCTLICFL